MIGKWQSIQSTLEKKVHEEIAADHCGIDNDPGDTNDNWGGADVDHEEGLRVIAARGFLNRAVEAKKICTIGKLRAPDVTEAMIKAADDAAAAWSKAAHNLRGMIPGLRLSASRGAVLSSIHQ